MPPVWLWAFYQQKSSLQPESSVRSCCTMCPPLLRQCWCRHQKLSDLRHGPRSRPLMPKNQHSWDPSLGSPEDPKNKTKCLIDTIASHNSYGRKIGLVSFSQLLSYPNFRDANTSNTIQIDAPMYKPCIKITKYPFSRIYWN